MEQNVSARLIRAYGRIDKHGALGRKRTVARAFSTSGSLREDPASPETLAVECPECGHVFGTAEDTCPGCGAPAFISQETPLVSGAPPPLRDTTEEAQISGGKTVLWSPLIITIAGVPLGLAWSTILIALNWHRLGKHWAAVLTWGGGLLFQLLVQQPLVEALAYPWPFLVGALIWFPFVGLPQFLYLRNTVGVYLQRSWILPASIGIAFQAVLLIWTNADARSSQNPSKLGVHLEGRKPFTPQEASALLEPRVFEVWTSWRESSYIFWSKESGSAGSAVLLHSLPGELRLVTNRHVIQPPEGATDYRCHLRFEGQMVLVTVWAVARNGVDLALLRLRDDRVREKFDMPLMPVTQVAPGQQCIAIGNALGAGASTTSGIISRIDEIAGRKFIRTSAPISHGNSGGGLFSLEDGSLLGITTATLSTGENQNVNLVIPTDYLTDASAWESVADTVNENR